MRLVLGHRAGQLIVPVTLFHYFMVFALVDFNFHLWQRYIPTYVNLMKNARRKEVETSVLVIPIIMWIMVGALTLVLINLKASWPCLEQSPSNVYECEMWSCMVMHDASPALNKKSVPSYSYLVV